MDLRESPFFLLGVSARDNRRRIQELVEEKSLLTSDDGISEAGSVLLNPRRRLVAELAWLPGLGPRSISRAFSILETVPSALLEQAAPAPVTRANLLAAGFVQAGGTLRPDDVVRWIHELAASHDQIDAEATMSLLNEDRLVAGFPEIADSRAMECELTSCRERYRRALKAGLDRRPTVELVELVTRVVDEATERGERHAPVLIDDLVDSYALEADAFLEREGRNVELLVDEIADAADSASTTEEVEALVEQLRRVVLNWDSVAQPIQVNHRSRGSAHGRSRDVAHSLRNLALRLHNEKGFTELSQKVVTLSREVFAEVDKVAEQAEADLEALDQFVATRSEMMGEMSARTAAWAEEITYEAAIGVIGKKTLRISPEGIEWGRAKVPLEDIKSVRWGGTRHSVNGVPTGTTYMISIYSPKVSMRIDLRRTDVYTAFVQRLWKAVCVRLLTEFLESLRRGERIEIGRIMVDDYGIELRRERWFSATEHVRCPWSDLAISEEPGCFVIRKKDERRVDAALSYQDVDNVHILEGAMRAFWKRGGARISSLLEDGDSR